MVLYMFGGIVVAAVAFLVLFQAMQTSNLKDILRQATLDSQAGLERQRKQSFILLDGLMAGMTRNAPILKHRRDELEELRTVDFMTGTHKRGPFAPPPAKALRHRPTGTAGPK